MANVGTASPGVMLPATNAIPYWTSNNEGSGNIWYDKTSLDSHMVSLHDGKAKLTPLAFAPLQGCYSVMLQDGVADGPTCYDSYISQVGDVPEDAKSIMFCSDRMFTLDRFVVSLNGTVIPMHVYSTGETINPLFGPITTYIGDVSAFAEMTNVELRFTKLVQDLSSHANHGQVDLDDIQFSATPAPEPSSLALLALGLLLLAGYCWRRRVCQSR